MKDVEMRCGWKVRKPVRFGQITVPQAWSSSIGWGKLGGHESRRGHMQRTGAREV